MIPEIKTNQLKAEINLDNSFGFDMSQFKDLVFEVGGTSNSSRLDFNSDIYNKLYSIFLGIIEKGNDGQMKSNPKFYFDLLVSYSLQKHLKRKSNPQLRLNYIPEIVGCYEFSPGDNFEGLILVFDVPVLIENDKISKLTIDIKSVITEKQYSIKIQGKETIEKLLTQHTASFFPYLYNKYNLQPVATNKSFRCLNLDKIKELNFKSNKNEIYEISLEIDVESNSKEIISYNFSDDEELSKMNEKLNTTSTSTELFCLKDLSKIKNDNATETLTFQNTIDKFLTSREVSKKQYICDYINSSYKYCVKNSIFGYNFAGISGKRGDILKAILSDFLKNDNLISDEKINFKRIINSLNAKSGNMYSYSLWPRNSEDIYCAEDSNLLYKKFYILNRSVRLPININPVIQAQDGKYLLLDNIDVANPKYIEISTEPNITELDTTELGINAFKKITYKKIKEPVSLFDVQLFNISKFLCELINLSEQGYYLKHENLSESPHYLGKFGIIGSKIFYKLGGVTFEE